MKCLFFFASLIVMCPLGQAGELHLIVSGKVIHFSSRSYNENNWGLGFEYDFEKRNNWLPLITAVSFKDSNDQTSNYLAGGAKRRFLLSNDSKGLHIDAGIVGFLMTRHDYKNNQPFPGVLPFASIGNHWAAVNITYVPKIRPKMVAFVYFQLMFKLAEF